MSNNHSSRHSKTKAVSTLSSWKRPRSRKAAEILKKSPRCRSKSGRRPYRQRERKVGPRKCQNTNPEANGKNNRKKRKEKMRRQNQKQKAFSRRKRGTAQKDQYEGRSDKSL